MMLTFEIATSRVVLRHTGQRRKKKIPNKSKLQFCNISQRKIHCIQRSLVSTVECFSMVAEKSTLFFIIFNIRSRCSSWRAAHIAHLAVVWHVQHTENTCCLVSLVHVQRNFSFLLFPFSRSFYRHLYCFYRMDGWVDARDLQCMDHLCTLYIYHTRNRCLFAIRWLLPLEQICWQFNAHFPAKKIKHPL